MSREVKDALNLARNLNRVGRVNTVNATKGTVTVLFEDLDNSIGYDLPLLKIAGIPEVGEQVLCVYIGPEDGFCLGGFYSDEDPPLAGTP